MSENYNYTIGLIINHDKLKELIFNHIDDGFKNKINADYIKNDVLDEINNTIINDIQKNIIENYTKKLNEIISTNTNICDDIICYIINKYLIDNKELKIYKLQKKNKLFTSIYRTDWKYKNILYFDIFKTKYIIGFELKKEENNFDYLEIILKEFFPNNEIKLFEIPK
jgi:hypothetical protein